MTEPEATRMKKKLLTVCALLLASAGALAAEPDHRGFYVGAMAGVTKLDDDGLFAGLSFDDSGTGYGIFGGYKFFRYLAVEARLSNLGSYRVVSQDFDVTAISAHVIGIIPFGASGWELFGQLGIGRANVNTDCCGDEDQTVASGGIGVRFYPTPHLGISLQTDAYVYEENDFYDTYDVGVAATELAVHYLF
jgi:Outer membrane protein beta-barrel domain